MHSTPPANPPAVAEAAHTDAMTDSELGGVLFVGLVAGIPLMFGVVVLLCTAAGLSLGNSLAIAVMPALFSSVFFGGMVPLFRYTARHEHGVEAARAAAMTSPAPVRAGDELIPVPVPAAG